jgi:O-glycosyl hydrolase
VRSGVHPLAPLLACAFVALGVGPCPAPYPSAAPARVSIDPSTQHQTIAGLGGSATNGETLRAMPEPDRSQVLDLVFKELEPSVVRFTIPHEIEPVNDDDDPEHMNPSGFVRPDDHLWQIDEIMARGTPALMAAPWSPPAWMKNTSQTCCGGSLRPGMEPELAEFLSAYMGFLARDGHPLRWLSLQNEPESPSPWDANTYAPQGFADAAEAVALRALRDGHTARLVAPDTALSIFAPFFVPFLLAMPTAGPWTEAVAFHLYAADYYAVNRVAPAVADLRSKVPAALPIWMTEYSNTTGIGDGSYDEAFTQAALIHQTLTNGAGMYLIWQLYRPGGPGEALVVISPTPGAPGYTVTPKYWTARQYLKFVRPGAVRIDAASEDAALLVSAYRNPDGATVAVLLNESDTPRWALVSGGALEGPPRFVRTSPGENGVDVPETSTDRIGSRMLWLPARSVSTAVWGPARG